MTRRGHILGAALLFSVPAFAHDGYEGWKDKNGVSCCSEHEDCHPTVAWKEEDGLWHAKHEGAAITVPSDRVLDNRKSHDGRSHICVRYGRVLCFVPGEVRSEEHFNFSLAKETT